MIKRIYIKGIYFVDLFFAFMFKQLKYIGIVNPLLVKEFENKNDVIKVVHSYPLNYHQDNKLLFNEWKEYNTFENKLFYVTNSFISHKGVVFKWFQCFVPALPHPVFNTEFGFLYILGQRLLKQKIGLDDSKKYLLIFDFWSCANYYHWMVDSLCRIVKWESELKEYTVLLPEQAPKYIMDTIRLFDFNDIQIIPKNKYVYTNALYIPNYSAWSGQQHPIVLKRVKELLLTSFKEHQSFERVYVSRSQQKHRKISNENDVVTLLKMYDFKIIHFEGMTVSQQISVVKSAKVFISSHGANMTNAMFGTSLKILELLRNDKPNFCYWSTFNCLDMPYYYQLCKVVNHDDLFVDLELLEQNLKLIL